MKFKITLNGRNYEIEVETIEPMSRSEYEAEAPVVEAAPVIEAAPVAEPTAPAASQTSAAPVASGDGEAIKAPMPGTVVNVNVTVGQAVKEGDVLVVLEAMKMENEVTSPKSGTVTQIVAQKGSSVETDAVLVVIK